MDALPQIKSNYAGKTPSTGREIEEIINGNFGDVVENINGINEIVEKFSDIPEKATKQEFDAHASDILKHFDKPDGYTGTDYDSLLQRGVYRITSAISDGILLVKRNLINQEVTQTMLSDDSVLVRKKPSGAVWSAWKSIDDLKANKIVTPETEWHYGDAGFFHIDYQSYPVAVGRQFEFWFDIQPAILVADAVDAAGNVTSWHVVQEGISSYEETYAYADWWDNTAYEFGWIDCTLTGSSPVTTNTYTDLPEVFALHNDLDAYTRNRFNDFYTKAVADNTFQKKNASATITKYAGANQLQTRINEVEKFLLVNNNAAQYLIDIHVQGNQSGVTYIQGFVGGGTVRIVFDGNYTHSGTLYFGRGMSIHCIVESAAGYKASITKITNNIGGYLTMANVSVATLTGYGIGAISLGNNTTVGYAELGDNMTLLINSSSASVNTLVGKMEIGSIVQDFTFGGSYLHHGIIFDNRASHALDTFVRRENVQPGHSLPTRMATVSTNGSSYLVFKLETDYATDGAGAVRIGGQNLSRQGAEKRATVYNYLSGALDLLGEYRIQRVSANMSKRLSLLFYYNPASKNAGIVQLHDYTGVRRICDVCNDLLVNGLRTADAAEAFQSSTSVEVQETLPDSCIPLAVFLGRPSPFNSFADKTDSYPFNSTLQFDFDDRNVFLYFPLENKKLDTWAADTAPVYWDYQTFAGRYSNLPAPVNGGDAATKQYVDNSVRFLTELTPGQEYNIRGNIWCKRIQDTLNTPSGIQSGMPLLNQQTTPGLSGLLRIEGTVGIYTGVGGKAALPYAAGAEYVSIYLVDVPGDGKSIRVDFAFAQQNDPRELDVLLYYTKN